jgi:hypothetical protein
MRIEDIQKRDKVKIQEECIKTRLIYKLDSQFKKDLLGTVQTVDRIKDGKIVVIKGWYFHPDDLTSPEIKTIEKPKSTNIKFDLESIM